MKTVKASDIKPKAPPRCPTCGQAMEYHGGSFGWIHCEHLFLYKAGGWLDANGKLMADDRLGRQ